MKPMVAVTPELSPTSGTSSQQPHQHRPTAASVRIRRRPRCDRVTGSWAKTIRMVLAANTRLMPNSLTPAKFFM